MAIFRSISTNFSTTRKLFRFFKHKAYLTFISKNWRNFRFLLSKFKKKFKHDRDARKDFNRRASVVDHLEPITEEENESFHSHKSRPSRKIQKSNSESVRLSQGGSRKSSMDDRSDKSDRGERVLGSGSESEQIDRNEYRFIKSPEFIDSKRQLTIKIFNSFMKTASGLFGFAYVFADHLSFLTKISVIVDPKKKKVGNRSYILIAI